MAFAWSWERLEDHIDNVPRAVLSVAEELLRETLAAGPEAEPFGDPRLGPAGWTLQALSVQYRRARMRDVMSEIVETAAREELAERLDEMADDEPGLMYEAFTLGDPSAGVIVIVRAPERWWRAEPLAKLEKEGLLRDISSGNDACPSLGTELADGGTLTIYTGHPHPDHHTRQDGCDPRFAIFLGDKDWEIDLAAGSSWEGESEEEAALQVRKIIAGHGGLRLWRCE